MEDPWYCTLQVFIFKTHKLFMLFSFVGSVKLKTLDSFRNIRSKSHIYVLKKELEKKKGENVSFSKLSNFLFLLVFSKI